MVVGAKVVAGIPFPVSVGVSMGEKSTDVVQGDA
jgi:hypothetical protein